MSCGLIQGVLRLIDLLAKRHRWALPNLSLGSDESLRTGLSDLIGSGALFEGLRGPRR